MSRNFRQAQETFRRQNAAVLYPIRFVSHDGRPLIYEYDGGVKRTELTWHQHHGGSFYARGGFLFTSRLEQGQVEALWSRELGMNAHSRVTFSDVIRAYLGEEPEQFTVSVKIQDIEVYPDGRGGGRARLSNVVEISRGTFVTFPRMNGVSNWWGYSALATEFEIHRCAAGMLSVIPWIEAAAALGEAAAGSVGARMGGELVKVVGRRLRRFPLYRIVHHAQIRRLIGQAQSIRTSSRWFRAGMRAWFVAFARGLASRLARQYSSDASGQREWLNSLRSRHGAVPEQLRSTFIQMIEQALIEAATSAGVAAIAEPLACNWRARAEQGRRADAALRAAAYEFDGSEESGRQQINRLVQDAFIEALIDGFRTHVVQQCLSAIPNAIAGAVQADGTINWADADRRVSLAIQEIPIIRAFADGASDPSGLAERTINDSLLEALRSLGSLGDSDE